MQVDLSWARMELPCYILYTPVVEKMTLIGYKAYNYDLVVG
jgi:hypothetical protein